MAKEIKQFKKDIESIRLSADEKKSLKSDFMNTLENTSVTREEYREPTISPFSIFFMKRYTSFAMAAFLIISTGTVYASESSIPGDTLYPIKINIAEKISSISDFTDQEKIDTKIQLTEKRLGEAKKLLSKKKYDVDSSEYIENKFTEYTEEINSFIESSKNGNEKIRSAETIIKLKKVLNNYDEELLEDAEYSDNNSQVVLVKNITNKISSNIKDLNDDQDEIIKNIKEEDSQDSLKSEADIKKANVENILKEKNKVKEEDTEKGEVQNEKSLVKEDGEIIEVLDEKDVDEKIEATLRVSEKAQIVDSQTMLVAEEEIKISENSSVDVEKDNTEKEEDEELDSKYREASELYENKKYLEAFVKFEEIEDNVRTSDKEDPR